MLIDVISGGCSHRFLDRVRVPGQGRNGEGSTRPGRLCHLYCTDRETENQGSREPCPQLPQRKGQEEDSNSGLWESVWCAGPTPGLCPPAIGHVTLATSSHPSSLSFFIGKMRETVEEEGDLKEEM